VFTQAIALNIFIMLMLLLEVRGKNKKLCLEKLYRTFHSVQL